MFDWVPIMSAYIYIQVIPQGIICILDISAVKYIFIAVSELKEIFHFGNLRKLLSANDDVT